MTISMVVNTAVLISIRRLRPDMELSSSELSFRTENIPLASIVLLSSLFRLRLNTATMGSSVPCSVRPKTTIDLGMFPEWVAWTQLRSSLLTTRAWAISAQLVVSSMVSISYGSSRRAN